MDRMTGQENAEAVQDQIQCGIPGARVTGVSVDSRTVNKGDLFSAIIGQRYDGQDFI